MIVFGASRLIYGVSIALQIGFGVSISYNIVYGNNPLPDTFLGGCNSPIRTEFAILLLPFCVICFAVLMNAQKSQIVGMIWSSSIAYIVGFLLPNMDAGMVSLFGAAAVTAVSRIYGYIKRRRSQIYIFSGLFILVPGGLSVKGMLNI